jgi:hypothetical protein
MRVANTYLVQYLGKNRVNNISLFKYCPSLIRTLALDGVSDFPRPVHQFLCF